MNTACGPLLALLLALYLLPCAVQDLRTRHVSNWLTIPEFVVAWPLALWLETLPFTLAVFAGCYIACHAGGMGPADGKLAVFAAAVAPAGVLMAGVLAGAAFAAMRLEGRRRCTLSGATLLAAGALCAVCMARCRAW